MRQRLSPAHVLRFDLNLPAFPAPLSVPAEEALAGRAEYPEGGYRELRKAAASYAGCSAEQVTVEAGADGLIMLVARTFLGLPRGRSSRRRRIRSTRSRAGSRAPWSTPRTSEALRSSGCATRRIRPASCGRGRRSSRSRSRCPTRSLPSTRLLRVLRGDGRGRGAEPRLHPHPLEGVRPGRAARRLRDLLARPRSRAGSTTIASPIANAAAALAAASLRRPAFEADVAATPTFAGGVASRASSSLSTRR